MFKCPFCTSVMQPVSATVVKCFHCDISFDMEKTKSIVGDNAPNHISEVVKFFNLCASRNPKFVLSKHQIFAKQFSVDTCEFFLCEEGSKRSIMDLSDYHLAAGAHNYSHNLLLAFCSGFVTESTINPIARTKYMDANEALYTYMLLSSIEVDVNVYIDLIDAYFADNLERTLDVVWNTFNSIYSHVQEESALYSLIFCTPDINIEWNCDPNKLMENIKNYCKACVRDVGKIEERNESLLSVSKYPEIVNNYIKSQPSLAVNLDGILVPTFDIMNHTYCYDTLKELNLESLDSVSLKQVNSMFTLFTSLYDRYANDSNKYGLRDKVIFLSRRNSMPANNTLPNSVVLTFWKEIEKVFRDEMS